MAIQTTLETSFLDFFVIFSKQIFFKIQMNIFSRLIYSIELFQRYKTIYFSKEKKIGHLIKNQENQRWNINFRHFFIFTENFIHEIEMNMFYRLTNSIDLFRRYETVYFSKSKMIGQFFQKKENYCWNIIFQLFLDLSWKFSRATSWSTLQSLSIDGSRWDLHFAIKISYQKSG